MADSIKHRHQTAIASSGADVDQNEWNDSHVFAGGTDGQVVTRDSAQADGWKWAASGLAPVAGALAFGTPVATSAPTNLTSLGTLDWWAPTNNTTPIQLQTQPYPHRKLVGGHLLEHWWIAGASGITLFTGAISTTITVTAADNRVNQVLTAFGTGALCFNGGGGVTGYGWGMSARASTTSRTIHIGARIWSGVTTLSASLSDGSATTTTTTITAGAGTGAEFDVPLTFNCSSLSGAVLNIQALLTTNSGSSPHLGLIYAYV